VKIEFQSIDFPSSKVGYVGGSLGYFAKTTNGGENWFQLKVPDTNFVVESMSFLSENVGYILRWRNYNQIENTNSTFIYKTTNGGISWTYTNTFLPKLRKELRNERLNMVNENVGYILLDKSRLFKTTDGWINSIEIELNSDMKTSQIINVIPISLDTIFVVNYSKVFKSIDGGKNWMKIFEVESTNQEIMNLIWNYSGKLNLTYFEKTPDTIKNSNLLLESNDFGNTWQSPSDVKRNTWYSFTTNNNIILTLQLKNSKYSPIISLDNGKTWKDFEDSNSVFGWSGFYGRTAFVDPSSIFLTTTIGILKIDYSSLVTSIQESTPQKEISYRDGGDFGILDSQNDIISVECVDIVGNKQSIPIDLNGNIATIQKTLLPNGMFFLQVQTSRGIEVVPIMNVR